MGMSFFFTESRIEDLMEQETRSIPGPDGERVTITAFKMFWKAYDFLILFGIDTAEGISHSASTNGEKLGISFGDSFASIVWHANQRAREVLGIDCFAIRQRTT